MNILLIGGSNSLLNQMIKKLNKEGHRISLLTGSRFRMEKYERVYERYDFSYDAVNLPEVFTAVCPDVTICFGAYDSNYRWSNDQSEAVRYVSGLMNILTAYAGLRQGRFIYLSSQVVFSGMDHRAYTEADAGNAVEFRGMAVSQGEELCESFRHNRKLDIVTVRLGEYYYLPRSLGQIDNTVSRMCCEALTERRIRAKSGHTLSLIYESDAVQFLSQIAEARECRESRYHLSGPAITESELAELVRQSMEKAEESTEKQKILVLENETAGAADLTLDSGRFREEFGMNRHRDLADAVDEIAGYMALHETVFTQDTAEAIPWYRRLYRRMGTVLQAMIPFAENLICFIPFFMLNNRAAGSQYFAKVDFYLLYVLLFAVVHGQQQAALSATLATLGYLLRQMYHRTGYDVLLDYNTYIWIAQIFVVGLVVGYMKDQLRLRSSEAKEDHSYMSGQIDDIKEINSSNVRVKDAMRMQIINQTDSVGKIYEITSTLNQYSYEEVLFYAAEILEKIMDTKDVAIYTVDNVRYARLFTATSKEARMLGNSVKYTELTELYQAISHRTVFINRQLDPKLPMMANAIYEGDEMRLITMVWKLPWEKMTLGQADLLVVTGALIQNAALSANRYLEALRSGRFVADTPILNQTEFQNLVAAYNNARERQLTVFSLIALEASAASVGATQAGAEPGLPSSKQAVQLSRQIRPHDYLGEGPNGSLYVLLTNTDSDGAEVVMDRLRRNGFACRTVEALL